jgi:hypothetical protein
MFTDHGVDKSRLRTIHGRLIDLSADRQRNC